MVTFDASLPSTPATKWAADPRRHDRAELRLDGIDQVVVIAAHPDDETLGAAGLLAQATSLGLPTVVVVVTDGAASGEPGIAERRSAELAAALEVLAPHAVVHELGFPDGETDASRRAITTTLRAMLDGTLPGALVAMPWRGDGHRDHRVVGEIAAELASSLGRRFVEYPIWLWHWGDVDDVPWSQLRSIGVDPAQKARALDAYRSQTEGGSAMLRPDFLEHFAGDELYILEPDRLDASYFDDLYARHEDPWSFDDRWYERRKRALTIAAMPDERYARALEIGCSLGHLTQLLAERCDDLLAVDVSQAAVQRARERLGDRARIECVDVLEDFPAGVFDLIVLSEVGYYFQLHQLDRVLAAAERALTPGGTLLACHWRHPVADYPLLGDQVHEALRDRSWHRLSSHVEEDFVLEVFSADGRSVATRTGLV
jgi:LmbE family N-acetylglucosaminyl deacetylase/ubiquinone/menaquinone biosynthesis C-methylase UbiE